MNKKVLFALVSVSLLAAGCGKMQPPVVQQPTGATSPSPTAAATNPASAVVETGDVATFTVKGSNFAFEPKVMQVKKGDKVKIIFENTVGVHDWVVDEFSARTKVIKAGETETIEFVADKAGTFEYYCSVGSHRQLGMKGSLIVQ